MPIFAIAAEYESRPVSWWDSAIFKCVSNPTNVPIWDSIFVLGIADHVFGAVYAGSSPDKLHHGTVTAEGERGGVDKAGKPYVWVKCKYCGDMFKGYASDLSAAYDDYVSELLAPNYGSTGELRWRLNVYNHGYYGGDARETLINSYFTKRTQIQQALGQFPEIPIKSGE